MKPVPGDFTDKKVKKDWCLDVAPVDDESGDASDDQDGQEADEPDRDRPGVFDLVSMLFNFFPRH